MEEKNYDYTGAEVQDIKIDEEFAAEQARHQKTVICPADFQKTFQ